ncbi:MAG: thiolase family protein [Spongiibacteraceae bacterium]
MAERLPEKSACITGIGQSEVGRPSSRTAMQLTVDACLQAIADAGLKPKDIDGLTTYPGKSSEGGGISPVGATEAMMALGLTPTWIGASIEGHAHMGAIFQAIMAVASGLCRHVLVFRTVAQATARAMVKSSTLLSSGRNRVDGNNAWTVPFNALSPVNTNALYAQAYFQKYGATSEQLGWIAVNGRRMAALNPNAIYRKPITLDDYLSSRVISSPLRLFDCDTHIDGSTALIISHRDAAKDLRNPPIYIEAMGMSISALGMGIHTGDFTSLPADKAGAMMWSRTDLQPRDVDVAQIYDGFSILTLLWLEAMQLCGKGEAAAFVEGGKRIALDGELPLNTSGGQLSAGRFHGYGHTHEACVQLWKRGGERQVRDAKVCAVSNGGYGYGALLLRTD